MIAQWRTSISAAVRRTSFWVSVAVAANALLWLLVWNSRLTFPLNAQSLFGIRLGHRLSLALVMVHFVGVPLLALFLVSVLIFALVRHLRRPPVVGVCRSCGYDLRATPERCPECGAAPIPRTPPADNQTWRQTAPARWSDRRGHGIRRRGSEPRRAEN